MNIWAPSTSTKGAIDRLLITVGVFQAAIWLVVSLISFGIPLEITKVLKKSTFGMLNGAIANMYYGFHYDVANKNMPTVIFLLLFSLAFVFYFGASVAAIRSKGIKKSTFLIVIFFAILFRLILLPSTAIHENDFYRYLWDGKVLKSGLNPYKYTPDEIESLVGKEDAEKTKLIELRDKNPLYFYRIGHRWVPTIYPPIAQIVFTLSSWIKEDSILVLKTIFVIFDLLVLGLIAKLLVHFKMNPALSMVYGWSPLVLKEIANSGHYDSIAIFFMLLSIYLIFRQRLFWGGVSLAFAGLAKFFPLLLAPLYGKRIKVRNLLVFAGLFLIFYIPFFLWDATGLTRVFTGLRIYFQNWSYNGSIFVLIRSLLNAFNVPVFEQNFLAKVIVGLTLVLVAIYLSKERPQADFLLLRRSFIILALLFLLSPVADPWYFCWVIPFLCFFYSRAFIMLSWLLIFSYLSFSKSFGSFRIGSFELPILNIVQYLPFFFLLLWGRFRIICCKQTSCK
jgi:hypothetical protein